MVKKKTRKKTSPKTGKTKPEGREKTTGKATSFDDMIAYVDEHGMITSTPPEERHDEEKIVQEDIQISIPRQEAPAILKGRVEYFDTQKGVWLYQESGRDG